jgi:hypothetical protein
MEAIKATADKLKTTTKNATWQAYLGEWAKEAGVRLVALRKP